MPLQKEDIEFLSKYQMTREEYELVQFLRDKELTTDEAASFLGVSTNKARSILTKLWRKGKVQRRKDGRIKWYGGEI